MDILDASARVGADGPSFTLRNRLSRAAWAVCWLALARWTPGAANGWRIALLRAFGANVSTKAAIASSARVWLPANLTMRDRSALGPATECYNMAPIELGEGAIVSQRASLCAGTHDIRDPRFQLQAKPITIGARAWIAAEAFVGPGVTVGEGAVLGARGCAFTDLEPWGIYRGNPAAKIGTRHLRPEA